MLSIQGDLHTHTLACGHALGTVTENLAFAARKGHRFMAATEHCGRVPVAPHLWYFNNLMRMPREHDGVILLYGVECNIIDRSGTVDLPEWYLKHLDLVIASAHVETFEGDRSNPDYTEMYCAAARNPWVDIIGHCGDPRFSHDCVSLVRTCRDHGKIIEINASSPKGRRGSAERCREIAALCKQYGVMVSVSSDAHCPQNVGEVGDALDILREVGFPQELILNGSYEQLRRVLSQRRGTQLPE